MMLIFASEKALVKDHSVGYEIRFTFRFSFQVGRSNAKFEAISMSEANHTFIESLILMTRPIYFRNKIDNKY